jgi:uncharacterized protein
VLLLFRGQSNRAILAWAAVLVTLPILQYTALLLLSGGQAQSPEAAAESAAFMDALVATMASGPASRIFLDKIGSLIFGRWPDLIFTGRIFKVLAIFLAGFYIGRVGILTRATEYRPLLRRVLAWGLLLGLPLNLGLAVLMEMDVYYALQPLGVLQSVAYGVGVPALALAYAAGFTLLYLDPAVQRRLALFVPVGRTALSNYLLQTVVCTLIFTGYGLGYAGAVGVVGGLLLACLIFVVQIGISTVWLQHFRFGPAEWLWRSLTYGTRQPMRLPRAAPALAPIP